MIRVRGNASRRWARRAVAVTGACATIGAVAVVVPSVASATPAVGALITQLTDPSGATGAGFGGSVHISGSTIVVSAPYEAASGVANAGTVYVYHRNGPKVTEVAALSAPDPQQDGLFGQSVAVDGSTIAVAAPLWNPGGSGTSQGAVYLYSDTAHGWQLTSELHGPDPAFDFGNSVALSANSVAVDATDFDGNGTIYVFAQAAGRWPASPTSQVIDPDPAPAENFGVRFTMVGNTIVDGDNSPSQNGPAPGLIKVFQLSGSTWKEVQEITPKDGVPSDEFGDTFSTDSTEIAVGAPRNGTPGSAYVYRIRPKGLALETELTPASADGTAGAGSALGLAHDMLIIGASNGPAYSGTGEALLYTKQGGQWILTATLTPPNLEAGELAGFSVAVGGGTAAVTALPAPFAYGSEVVSLFQS